MHELSIAQSVVEAVAGHLAGQGGARVTAVVLRVGALSGVEVAALRFAWDVATAASPLDGARLEIEEVGLAAFCPACRAERALPSPQRLRCPVCGAATPEIVRGRELEILEVAVEEPDSLALQPSRASRGEAGEDRTPGGAR